MHAIIKEMTHIVHSVCFVIGASVVILSKEIIMMALEIVRISPISVCKGREIIMAF